MSGETRAIPAETWQFSFTSRLPLRGRLRNLPLHVLFVRHGAELLLQIVLVFLDQRRVPRPAVDLGRLVLALVELLLGPVIVSVRDLRLVDNPLHQVRRDERNALLVAEYHVSRHHRGVADADRNVDPRDEDAVDGRWRGAPVVSSQIGQRRDAIQVADGPVDNKAGARRLHDVIGQVVADHAAAATLPNTSTTKMSPRWSRSMAFWWSRGRWFPCAFHSAASTSTMSGRV